MEELALTLQKKVHELLPQAEGTCNWDGFGAKGDGVNVGPNGINNVSASISNTGVGGGGNGNNGNNNSNTTISGLAGPTGGQPLGLPMSSSSSNVRVPNVYNGMAAQGKVNTPTQQTSNGLQSGFNQSFKRR